MAHTYKNVGFNLTSTSKTDIFTVDTGSTVLVQTIQTTNYAAGNIDIIGYVYDSSASTEYELAHHTLNSKDSINVIDGTLVLESGDILRLESDTANALSGIVSYLEIT